MTELLEHSAGWLDACARAYAPGGRSSPLVSPLRASWAGIAPTVEVGASDDLLAADATPLGAPTDSEVTVRTRRGPWHDFAPAVGQLREADEATDVIARHAATHAGWDRVDVATEEPGGMFGDT